MDRCTSDSGRGYECTATRSAASPATRPAPLDGLVEYGAGALTDLEQLVNGLPSDPIDAWDPEHIRRTLPWLKAVCRTYFRGEVERAREHPGRRAVAAGRQPLRRAADRRHVRVLGRVLRPLRARPALPPARPRRRRQEPAAGPDPPLRRRARLARQRARGVRPRRAGARLPRRRLRDVPPQLALATRSSSAAARASSSSRSSATCRSSRSSPSAARRPRCSSPAASAPRKLIGLDQLHAHQGAAGLDRPAVRHQPPRPARRASRCRPRSRSRCCRRSTCASASAPTPTPTTAYEDVTAEMQDALSALDEERTLPVVG